MKHLSNQTIWAQLYDLRRTYSNHTEEQRAQHLALGQEWRRRIMALRGPFKRGRLNGKRLARMGLVMSEKEAYFDGRDDEGKRLEAHIDELTVSVDARLKALEAKYEASVSTEIAAFRDEAKGGLAAAFAAGMAAVVRDSEASSEEEKVRRCAAAIDCDLRRKLDFWLPWAMLPESRLDEAEAAMASYSAASDKEIAHHLLGQAFGRERGSS